MPARTVLFGATGYTGRLVAEAMVERGMRPVLAARGRDALEALAADLGGLETAVADVSDPAGVRALIEKGDVLLTTVGPFARWGEPAAVAASSAGAHYIGPIAINNLIHTWHGTTVFLMTFAALVLIDSALAGASRRWR